MSGTTTVIYRGPFRDGLELSESLGFGFIEIPHGKPVELPTEIALRLLDERPDEFTRPKPKKAAAAKPSRKPRKAAATRAATAPTPDPDPAPADTQEA